jgi:hypothetical protein
MSLFRITYFDPDTGDRVQVENEYQATDNISAFDWAVDHAYGLADKGSYTIEECVVKGDKQYWVQCSGKTKRK